MGKQVLIAGASGMVGSAVLKHCLQDANVTSITSLVAAVYAKLLLIVLGLFAAFYMTTQN